jgi:fumarate hydratase class II
MAALASSPNLAVCPICGGGAPLRSAAIGWERTPDAWLQALARVRAAAARANARCGALDGELAAQLEAAALAVAGEPWGEASPSLWADGAGLAMAAAVDARIAARTTAPRAAEAVRLHQCADAVITAARLAADAALSGPLPAALAQLEQVLAGQAEPLAPAWREELRRARRRLADARLGLAEVPLGSGCTGSAFGLPAGFAAEAVAAMAEVTKAPVRRAAAPTEALAAHDPLVFAQAALASAAVGLHKIAGDLLSLTGARGALAGASQVLCASLPGKRLPAHLEAARQACVQVTGAQSAVTFAGSQGQFELNAFLPLMTYGVLRSAALLEGAADAFARSLTPGEDVGEMAAGGRVNQEMSA